MNWLLLDSSDAVATLAVGGGGRVLSQAGLAGRNFSAEWSSTLRRLLKEADVSLSQLDVIGVVAGPGSFTGVRVGLAVAKGLCEALGAKLVAISYLELLSSMTAGNRTAVMSAGRGEFYVRRDGHEALCSLLAVSAPEGESYVTADKTIADELRNNEVLRVTLHAASAVPLLLQRIGSRNFNSVDEADANYVRGERDIYGKKFT